jgi:predicted small lipoprotein YifL
MTSRFQLPVVAALVFGLAACGNFGGDDTVYPDDDNRKRGTSSSYEAGDGRLLGEGGLFGESGPDDEGAAGGSGIGVNSYLWRASLDTISFMPVASADPFGGVILTDWYSPPEAADERFKVNLYILGRQLRADGLRAAVFRQERGAQGQWRDVEVNGQTATELENAILSRAREMRVAATASE